LRLARIKISSYAPYVKERFETAHQHLILHPERIVGNPEGIKPWGFGSDKLPNAKVLRSTGRLAVKFFHRMLSGLGRLA
jgi:hypothetical protein